MTKYALIYKNDNNESIFCGSFIGKNHHKIKFVMYRSNYAYNTGYVTYTNANTEFLIPPLN